MLQDELEKGGSAKDGDVEQNNEQDLQQPLIDPRGEQQHATVTHDPILYSCLWSMAKYTGCFILMAAAAYGTYYILTHQKHTSKTCSDADILTNGQCYTINSLNGDATDYQGNSLTINDFVCDEVILSPASGQNYAELCLDQQQNGNYAGTVCLQYKDSSCFIDSTSGGYSGTFNKTADCTYSLQSTNLLSLIKAVEEAPAQWRSLKTSDLSNNLSALYRRSDKQENQVTRLLRNR